jgi:sugar fermentation stimulation protein A
MLGCQGDGWPVLLSRSDNPNRKYSMTWELVHNGTCWIGINTHRANRLAVEAIENGTITELKGFDSLRREVALGTSSRADILLENTGSRCWVEVKNVTLVDGTGRYAFPDAPTERGRKHLRELAAAVATGERAFILFVIQRSDGDGFTPAADIDPAYAREFDRAVESGVEALAYRAEVTPTTISIVEPVPISF